MAYQLEETYQLTSLVVGSANRVSLDDKFVDIGMQISEILNEGFNFIYPMDNVKVVSLDSIDFRLSVGGESIDFTAKESKDSINMVDMVIEDILKVCYQFIDNTLKTQNEQLKETVKLA